MSSTTSPSISCTYPSSAETTMPLYTAIPRMIPMKRQDISMPVTAPWFLRGVTAWMLTSISVIMSPNPSPITKSENPTPTMPLGIRKNAPMNAIAMMMEPVRTRGRIPS